MADRVLAVLRGRGGPLDDDELAARLGVVRQQINQVCRRLEQQGRLRRSEGPSGKIVNALPDEGAMPPPASRPTIMPGATRMSEDSVKQAVRDHLEALGYRVEVAWGRERGIDLDARHPDGRRLIIEAKGEAPAGPQQVNYFLGALGELVQRMSDPEADYGLALPDHRQYHGLVERLPDLARQRLRLRVFFVSQSSDRPDVAES